MNVLLLHCIIFRGVFLSSKLSYNIYRKSISGRKRCFIASQTRPGNSLVSDETETRGFDKEIN